MHDGSSATGGSNCPVRKSCNKSPAARPHSLAVTAHGDLYAWGKGWRGELGLGDDRNRCGPEKVSGKHQFLRVAAGDRHTLAIALKHKSIGRKLRESRPLEAPNAHVGLQRSACCALTKLFFACVRRRRRPVSSSIIPESLRRQITRNIARPATVSRSARGARACVTPARDRGS